MFDIKSAKTHARVNVRKHYVIFVLACLLAAYLGSAYNSTLSEIRSTRKDAIIESIYTGKDLDARNFSAESVLYKILQGKYEESEQKANELLSQQVLEGYKVGVVELGRANGILSGIVNNISSGKFIIIVFQTIMSVTNSDSTALAIFIGLIAFIMLSIIVFVKDTYKVAFRRIFLEGYIYDDVKVSRFLFLFRVKKFIKAAITIFAVDVLQILWNITIVGGVIKYYEFFMVPYIVAENPDINFREAIKLSRRMMYEHKMECFYLDLSFIGWEILGILTLGISKILYSNPFKEATIVEYYVYIRAMAKEKGVSYANRFNDQYLFEKADEELLKSAYADVIDIMYDDIELKDCKHSGIRGFVEDNFGIIYKYDDEEDKYNAAIEQEEKIAEYKKVLDLKQYPGRLFPIAEEDKNPRLEHTHYLRHYSIWSVVALFFIFCFIGWSWEVMLHIVEDGVFVNRGVNHGPWLPIYGAGGVMILVLLFRFRNKPGLEALSAIVLCGTVEYFTHWLLEVSKGTKWWDYSGYFLNINGRICAEGLIVFMLGGMAIVYALAPIIDNYLRKMNQKRLKVICIVLLSIFAIDVIYSAFKPNMGAGITDYGETVFNYIRNYLL